jgi:hypothetical protein
MAILNINPLMSAVPATIELDTAGLAQAISRMR